MTTESVIHDFIVDWFLRFDRLDPPENFLKDLHPDVVWDMPDVDESLHGHDRFLKWYEAILATFESPTEHYVSNITLEDGGVSFEVHLKARTKQGEPVSIRAKESWRYDLNEHNSPVLTHYTATFLD